MSPRVRRTRLQIGLVVATGLIISAVVFFPFDFCAPNRVSWLSPEPGVYFEGEGIAYTSSLRDDRFDPLGAVTVELWLREREGSRNWGAREIFSFYDDRPSPPLLIGEFGGRVFAFSRFESVDAEEWWSQFRPDQELGRGRLRFVAVTYQEEEKALFVDGVLVERQPIDLRGGEPARFSGRLILGNSPTGRNGWWGEVHGLAIYGRALTSDEIARHARVFRQDGLRPLAEEAAALALYPFDEGKGGTARNLASDTGHIQWSRRFASLAGSMLRYPGDDARAGFVDLRDMFQNFVLFIPFGYVLCMIATKRDGALRLRHLFAAVLFAGCFSAGIEIAQIYLPSRSASTMDIAWNTAGAFLGALAWYGAKGRGLRLASRRARS